MNQKFKLLIKLLLQHLILGCAVLCGLLLSSCSKDGPVELSGDGPDELRLGAAITGVTRATDAGFEVNDTLGIYIAKWIEGAASDTLKADGNYTDNVFFYLESLSNNWLPEYSVYYPSDNNKIDLYAYYPYRTPAFVSGTSLELTVATNQSEGNHYTRSDFMTAKTLGVSRTPNKVPLVFDHRLSQMIFVLKPGAGFSVNDLLPAKVKIINAVTDATFDLTDSVPIAGSVRSDIIPAGSWTAGHESLTGLKAIMIPQELNPNTYVEITIGSRRFTYRPASVRLNPGCSRVFTITVNNTGLDITTEINPWDNCPPVNGDADEEFPELVIDLRGLDWSESGVYKVMDKNDVQVAQVCKEYVPAIGFQAIVIYPVEKGSQDVNLKRGFVAQVLDTIGKYPSMNPINANVHGGRLFFTVNGLTTNCKYSKGNSLPLDVVYLYDHEITDVSGNTRDTATIIAEVLEDRDRNVYPIVKLGTQYWQGENMKSQVQKGNSYIYNDTKHANIDSNLLIYGRLYDFEGANSVVPERWKLPSDDDWKILELYLGMLESQLDMISINRGFGIGTILKSVNWWQKGLGSNNLSGLDMRPGGSGVKSQNHFFKMSTFGYWWSSTVVQDSLVYIRRLDFHTTITKGHIVLNDFSHSVRCLKLPD